MFACVATKVNRRRHSSTRSILRRPSGLSSGSFSSRLAWASSRLSSRRIRSTAHRVMYLGMTIALAGTSFNAKWVRATTLFADGRPPCPNERVYFYASLLWFCRRDCRCSGGKLMPCLCGWDSKNANELAARAHFGLTKTIISSKIRFLSSSSAFLAPIR